MLRNIPFIHSFKKKAAFFAITICIGLCGFAQAPVIDSLSTLSGKPKSLLTIYGHNFSATPAENIVNIGNVRATVVSANIASITVDVPDGALYMPVAVTVNHLTACSKQMFLPTFDGSGRPFTDSSFVQIRHSTNSNDKTIRVADVDGDGKPDIVFAGIDHFRVYLNASKNGNIAVGDSANFYMSSKLTQLNAVTPADVDGDGKIDIIAAGNGTVITVYKNISSPGHINFSAGIDIEVTDGSRYANAGDMDGDGKPEIVTTENGTGFSVLKNNSTANNISFSYVTSFSSPYAFPIAPILQDLDFDGKLDVASLSYLGDRINIFRNTSNTTAISFEDPITAAAGQGPIYFYMADIDEDGMPDLCFTNWSSQFFTILKNISTPGHIKFIDKGDFTVDGFKAMRAADMNGDKKPDLMVTSNSFNEIYAINNISAPGHISFSQPFTYRRGVDPFSEFEIADFNGDGKPDVVYSGSYSFFFLLNFDKPIPSITSFTPLSGPVGTIVTITGKNFDAAASNNTVYFGAVKAKVVSATPTSIIVTVPRGATYQPVTVTTNNLTAYSVSPFTVTFPGAAATFMPSSFGQKIDSSLTSDRPYFVSDIDGDGKADIAYCDSHTLYIRLNNSKGNIISFVTETGVAIDSAMALGAVGDVNGDGKPDIVITNRYAFHDEVSVIINHSTPGNILLDNPKYYSPVGGYWIQGVTIGDLNNDGKPDIAISCEGDGWNFQTGIVNLFENISNGSDVQFKQVANFSPGTGGIFVQNSAYDIKLADFDGDGLQDIAITENLKNQVTVYRNHGDFAFGEEQSFAATGVFTGSLTGSAYYLAVADYDSDGKPDIAVTNVSDTLAIFRNNSTPGNMLFAERFVLLKSLGAFLISSSDFDGDGKPDIVVGGLNDSAVFIYKNKSIPGTLAFTDTTLYHQANMTNGLLAGDFDNDGKPDLIAGTYYSNEPLIILRNQTGEAVVVPSGAHPVSGPVKNTIVIDPTVQAYNGSPYVQRHYDIQPAVNPSTSTATITLFFTQQDFDNFNAYPGHGPSLPTGPDDKAGIGNIRIYQYHGFSATSQPGTYNGAGVEIDPANSNITWDNSGKIWLVTFDVNGFSGFFLSNKQAGLLPLTLLSFNGSLQGFSSLLQWVTVDEINTASFSVQRGVNGRDFTPIATIQAKGSGGSNYQYSDENIFAKTVTPQFYYRLQMMDKDGRSTYSNIVAISKYGQGNALNVYPNPVTDYIIVNHPVKGTSLRVVDMNGKVIQTIALSRNATQTSVHTAALAAGVYKIVWSDGNTTQTKTIIKR